MSSMPIRNESQRRDVRAASTGSSVPWRNASPTPPSRSPVDPMSTKQPLDAAQPTSSMSSSASPSTQQTPQQPKVKDLVGYTAILSKSAVKREEDRYLGVVKEVISSIDTGTSNPLLRIISLMPRTALLGKSKSLPVNTSLEQHQDQDPNSTPETDARTHPTTLMIEIEHLIPLVRSIVPRIDPVNRRLLVEPPTGLLDLGQRRALLQLLKEELSEFILLNKQPQPGNSNTISNSNDTIPIMPVRRELMAAGRPDLVKLIQSAGGFIEVAQELGFKSIRRPPGYWEDEAVLDRELSLFVAANWVRFEEGSGSDDDEDGGGKLERAAFAIVDEGSSGSGGSSDESEQPSSQVWQGLEKEIHYADNENEETSTEVYWYNQVTRKVRWTEPQLPQTLELDDEGSTLLTETPEDRAMPSRSALFAAGRYDLHAAIVAAGGYSHVAEELDRYPAWPPTRHLRSFRRLTAELRDFVVEAGLPRSSMPRRSQLDLYGRTDLHQAILRHGGYVKVAEKLRWKSQRRSRGAWKNLEATAAEVRKFAEEVYAINKDKSNTTTEGVQHLKMPTHEELRLAGRHDLRHAVQKHGSMAVAEAAGLEVRRQVGLGRGQEIRQERMQEMALVEENN